MTRDVLLQSASPQDSQSYDNITRRQFFTGILGTGALLAGSSLLLAGCEKKDDVAELIDAAAAYAPTANIYYLDVPEDMVVASVDAEEANDLEYLRERASFDLPLGCLLYQNSENFAVVLQSRAGMPSNSVSSEGSGSAKNGGDATSKSLGNTNSENDTNAGRGIGSLITLSLLDLQSGALNTLLSSSVGISEDFIIYDARANDNILIWAESNLTSGVWRVYAAALSGGAESTRGPEVLLDEGDVLFEPPLLCVCNQSAYWTVLPDPEGAASREDSLLKRVRLQGTGTTASIGLPEQVYVSHGRMITTPQSSEGVLTFVPRVDVGSVFYQLTALNDATGEITEAAILPPSLRVSDAVFGPQGFSFQIEANYDYAKGLALYGTYQQLPDSHVFHANKTPYCPTVWINNCLYIKSTKNIIGFDLQNNRYFVVDTPKDCVDYGDVLAGSGAHQSLVAYTTITNKISTDKGVTRVRVLEPASPINA